MINLRSFHKSSERKSALEKLLKVDLQAIGSFTFDEKIAGCRNCENMIGATQIPLGIAGPLKITSLRQEFFIPLATTEGALVASVSRGSKAITLSGGAQVEVEKIGTTRGPVFRIRSLKEKKIFEKYLKTNFEILKKVVRKTDPHIMLRKFETGSTGRNFYVRFYFDTQDAMGMNMATIATQAVADFIEKRTKIKCLSVSGNYCVDKKPSLLDFINGRGFKVWAEVTLTQKILREVLKTSAKEIYDVWLAKCMTGAALAGSMGFNAQFANIVAAMFLATGQDSAHVVEGSMGITNAEIVGKSLYMSIYIPDLMLGTIGGGTGLATQKEALSILGINKGNNGKNAEKLAKIVGSAVLAGEISLLSSLSEGSLVKAHKQLGRGEKV